MSETPTETGGANESSDPAAGAGTLPELVELQVRGKQVQVPREKALTWASIGANQDRKEQELKAREAQLQENAERYAEFQRFTGHLEGDPAAAKAVQGSWSAACTAFSVWTDPPIASTM